MWKPPAVTIPRGWSQPSLHLAINCDSAISYSCSGCDNLSLESWRFTRPARCFMSLFSKQTSCNKDPHVCGDSLLRCVDCSQQVCPQCMVPCPVGNRCRPCAGKKPEGAVSARQLSSPQQKLRLL